MKSVEVIGVVISLFFIIERRRYKNGIGRCGKASKSGDTLVPAPLKGIRFWNRYNF
jgi:hypothetical protein